MIVQEMAGYLASALLLATFSVRTMMPLRLLGVSSSIAFLTYGILGGLLPIVILHSILLPLNLYRFYEMRRLTREIEEVTKGKDAFAGLLPFTSGISRPAGTVLFKRGDRADDLYVLTSGQVRLPELNAVVKPGETVGEIGMFAPDARRMATAVCDEDCKLQRITRERIRELVFQNPRIGFHLIGVVTGRLLEDFETLEKQAAPGSS